VVVGVAVGFFEEASVFVVFDVFGERQGERGKEEESCGGEKKWERK
jgi:hypothetical protein